MENNVDSDQLASLDLQCFQKSIKYNLTHLDMYNALSQVYCIKPEGRIHYIQRVLIPVIYRHPFRLLINQTIKKLLMILPLRCTILHNQVISYTKEWSKWDS